MLANKILAIASGKGGVGKSTTAVNIALLAVRSGKRTAIIDMDPLSNLSVILDLPSQNKQRGSAGSAKTSTKKEARKATTAPALQQEASELERYIQPAFSRLDILFSGTGTADIRLPLYELVFHKFARALNGQYDFLILDMPAGIAQSENLRILPELKNMLIVTNAEPTSHVASGGYIKAALEVNKSLSLYVWNNKFEAGAGADFNSNDLVGNYNRYAPEELRLPAEVAERMQHVAFVPEDRALNLLSTEVDFQLEILGKIADSLKLMAETVIPAVSNASEASNMSKAGSTGANAARKNMSSEEAAMLRYFVLQNLGEPQRALERYSEFFASLGKDGGETLPAAQNYIQHCEKNPMRKMLADCQQSMNRLFRAIRSGNSAQKDVYDIEGLLSEFSKSFMRCAALFNRLIERWEDDAVQARFGELNIAMVRKAAALSFFYFSMLVLLENKKVWKHLQNFIPKKRGSDQRDRYLQIRLLVEHNAMYRKNYFRLIKSIFPLMEKHVYKLSQETKNILFYNEKHDIMRNVYLKLLSELIHELLNAGLGIHVGLKFNTASMEIQKGWSQLCDHIGV